MSRFYSPNGWIVAVTRGAANGPLYDAMAPVSDLIRAGLCVPCSTNVAGFSPSATVRHDGMARVRTSARSAIDRDKRFQTAMARVLQGSPCVEFALPKRPGARDRQSDEETRRRLCHCHEEKILADLRALPLDEFMYAMHAALRQFGVGNTAEEMIAAKARCGKAWGLVLESAWDIAREQRSANDGGSEAAT